ncbi:uncharacterized protein LOC122854324 [Aphidius gifuensis]|uniref:uncharacterized protein LOC122854324 n=1 Tax=Aphidius gifuensis TaxID=684658 RepID=UPI001CDC6B9A|nr:uncharacterized protein LOC122854324 [Aphidius gifuensis]
MQCDIDTDGSMESNCSSSVDDVNEVNMFDNSMESSCSSNSNWTTSSCYNDGDANDVLNLSNTSSSDNSFEESDQVLDMSVNTSYSRHIGVQVNTGLISPLFCLNTDAELSTATGIESFPILDFIVEVVKCVIGSSNWHKKKRMSTREQIIMTYMKLKHNASYALLSLIFKAYSERHCQRVFKKMICILSKCLPKLAIRWPSREQNSRNMPKCFENFEDVIVIVDCTEIHIQVLPNLCCQLLTYSHYKGYNTFKFMTGVSPSGTITFISKAYGGSSNGRRGISY